MSAFRCWTGEHTWHFYLRNGRQWRDCKKCPMHQVKGIIFDFWHVWTG